MTSQANRALSALDSAMQQVGVSTYYQRGPEKVIKRLDGFITEFTQVGKSDPALLREICQEIYRHSHGVSLLEVILPRIVASGEVDTHVLTAGAPELQDYLEE